MRNILIITNYYPPELGAASNRIFHLTNGLQNLDFNITVLTPLPNYPTGKIFEGYKGKIKRSSVEKNVTIHRLWIYASNSSNKIKRLAAMLSFGFSLIWYFLWHKIPKTVIVQSPPLLVTFATVIFLNSKKRKLILNVSDLWPMAGLELGVFNRNYIYKILEKIERFNYKRAHLILGQSEEIISHVKSRFPQKKTFLYRNYPDFVPSITKQYSPSEGKITLVYAGLLGVAQGILELCQNLDYSNIEFHIYGVGSDQSKIEHFLKLNPDCPIQYHGEVSRDCLHKKLVKYDLTIIPLINRIYGSVPSKIFEYGLLGIPMIYFGGGEGERIVIQNQLGWVVEPCNYNELNNLVSNLKKEDLNLELRKNIQSSAIRNFDFKRQFQELTNII